MAQTMLFGFCYMPQAIRVEDFSPYWVLDRWTEARMLDDLRTMRALGSRILRVHITPPVPGANSYDRLSDRRTVPVTGEKYLRLYDVLVRAARDVGMRVHFDIGSSFSDVSEASLDGWIPRYRGLVESYQFANENYGVFESDMQGSRSDNFGRFQRLLGHARRLDPQARFTADVYASHIEHLRARFPEALRRARRAQHAPLLLRRPPRLDRAVSARADQRPHGPGPLRAGDAFLLLLVQRQDAHHGGGGHPARSGGVRRLASSCPPGSAHPRRRSPSRLPRARA
jgi:hypothetical protein